MTGKPMSSAPNLEENDAMHEKMMELEHLIETSGERNPRSFDITHVVCPCHCLAQTVWYPDHANLCLIRSIGLVWGRSYFLEWRYFDSGF